MIALVDCNNFFVSCERLFNPSLSNKPVIVLSNNDGCIIARSNEAKSLGIKMGEPYFKIEDLIKKHSVWVFSGNFQLYGDISNRIMQTLSEFTNEIEIYSIDEAFLNLSHLSPKGVLHSGYELKKLIQKAVGIPVSIGIAETKTLSKLASEIAKNDEKSVNLYKGVLNLTSHPYIDIFLQKVDVSDIWGVGRKSSIKMRDGGVFTAKDFKYAQRGLIQSSMGIMGLRTQNELNSITNFELDEFPDTKKSITSTRSFNTSINDITQLREAIAYHVSSVAKKLRDQDTKALKLMIFIVTSRFDRVNYRFLSEVIEMNEPTNNTSDMINKALDTLEKMYESKYKYKKAGVVAWHIIPQIEIQRSLFTSSDEDIKNNRKKKLMSVVDTLNNRFGSATIQPAILISPQHWQGKANKRSNQFTTSWNELLVVR